MFKFIQKISAPAVFGKGLGQYKQGNYDNAKQLLSTALKWMPDLEKDELFKALLLIIEFKLGADHAPDRFRNALESLNTSPRKETGDYSMIRGDLEKILELQQAP